MRFIRFATLTIVLLVPGVGAAQSQHGSGPEPQAVSTTAPEYTFTTFVRNWTRVEAWSFFEPSGSTRPPAERCAAVEPAAGPIQNPLERCSSRRRPCSMM